MPEYPPYDPPCPLFPKLRASQALAGFQTNIGRLVVLPLDGSRGEVVTEGGIVMPSRMDEAKGSYNRSCLGRVVLCGPWCDRHGFPLNADDFKPYPPGTYIEFYKENITELATGFLQINIEHVRLAKVYPCSPPVWWPKEEK